MSSPENTQQSPGVCIVATNGVYGMGVLQAKDMFYSASLRLALRQKRAKQRPRDFSVDVVEHGAFPVVIASPSGEPVQTYSGTKIQCDAGLDDGYWSVVILSHFWGEPDQQLADNPGLIEWLRKQSERQTAIMGFGSGVFWLAQAGLLDGKEATTYWQYLESFQQRFHQVKWQAKTPITEDGNVCCVMGATSANDMLLHYISKLCGVKVAQGISRDILFDSRRSYEVPVFGLTQYRQHEDYQIEQIQHWFDGHFSEAFEMAVVAKQFGMSLRNFARRFERATGEKPLAYLQQLRTTVAKDMLIYSDNSIKHIALDVGYQDSSYFSRLFKRHLMMSPAEYRRQYRRRKD